MNKRIKKKIAKRQIQEKQEELDKQLRKLSPEEIEAIRIIIKSTVFFNFNLLSKKCRTSLITR